ncbi:MAG: succinate dehydrogenase assembly factor 2 [Methylococcaceae bacterium]|nr:succinate dehydrogenase assembly factor 2 [Methylococcaceae bacterium]
MVESGKLKWRCRRGVLELDIVLERYLTTDYLTATDQERASFIDLLDLEDNELLEVMLEKMNSKS